MLFQVRTSLVPGEKELQFLFWSVALPLPPSTAGSRFIQSFRLRRDLRLTSLTRDQGVRGVAGVAVPGYRSAITCLSSPTSLV